MDYSEIMIPYEEYIVIIDNENETAKYFNRSLPCKFKYSKKYIYKWSVDNFTPDDKYLLWVQVTQNAVVEYMSSFFNKILSMYIQHDKTMTLDKISKLTKMTNQITKYKNMSNIYQFYQELIHDDKFYDNLNRFKPNHLPIKGGKVIDLKTGMIHPRTKEDYFTYEADVEYTPKRSEATMNLINTIMCNNVDNIKYLQKILGYCLTAKMDARVYFIFYGKGANGKSVILSLMNKILMEQYQSVSKCVFIDAGKGKTGGCEALQLKDCRLATFSETDGDDKLNESLIKMITGNDPITARALYKEPVTFNPTCKIIICTNNKPDFNANDKANVDRVRLVPFNARFVENPTKPNEFKKVLGLVDKIDINEFFSWCVDGAIEYYKNKVFEPSGDMLEMQNDYIREQSNIDSFIEDTYDNGGDNDMILKTDIKMSYDSWCKDNGYKPYSMKILYTKFDDIYGKSIKYKKTGLFYNRWVYKGLYLKPEPSDLDVFYTGEPAMSDA